MKRRDFATGLSAGLLAAPAWARSAALMASAPAAVSRRGRDVAAAAWAGVGPSAAPGRNDALLVLLDGVPVFEAYGADHGPTVRHIAWSMTKSVTQALVGAAVLQGRVDIDAPLAVAAHPGLTLRALLTLTDGLDWDEGGYDPAKSDAARLLFGPGRFDGAAFMAAKGQARPPGTHWNYSTGAFALAAAELQARLFPAAAAPDVRRSAMLGWMRASLFDPLGMTSAQPEFDAAGNFAGGSFFYATASDFGRFGELYRLDGMWKGRRLLPPGWVKFARTPTVEATYGAGFWLEAPAGHEPPSLMAGAGPMDAFSAQGHEGQVILIVPSKALVLVRLGLMDDGDPAWKALGAWLAPIANAFPDRA